MIDYFSYYLGLSVGIAISPFLIWGGYRIYGIITKQKFESKWSKTN